MSIEAIILLPVFLLIFAGVLLMQRLWESKQQALVRARSCAWEYANNGCDRETLSKDCRKEVRDANGVGGDNRLEKDMNGGVLDGLGEIPIVGPVVAGLFSSALLARVERSVQRSPLVSEGNSIVVGSYYLMCNERKRDMLDLIETAFEQTLARNANDENGL